MERRINKKIEIYLSELKENIRKKISEIDESDSNLHKMLEYIYDYDRLNLCKEDFMKRKRVKNIVHLSDRCCAKRANGDQCTRRRKEDTTVFCGTHLKGTPHGICSSDDDSKPEGKKIEVWAQDIQGIVYYIDKSSNVYQIEDIMEGKSNPKVIAKYVKIGETYVIPEFNMD